MKSSKTIARYIREGRHLEAIIWLLQTLEHDIACWKEIRENADRRPEYINAFSGGRVECLKLEVDRLYNAVEAVEKSDAGKTT